MQTINRDTLSIIVDSIVWPEDSADQKASFAALHDVCEDMDMSCLHPVLRMLAEFDAHNREGKSLVHIREDLAAAWAASIHPLLLDINCPLTPFALTHSGKFKTADNIVHECAWALGALLDSRLP